MNLDEFLRLMRTNRIEWDTVLARVPLSRMEQRGLPGGWSIKDLIAHITWFEREMVKLVHTRSLAGGSPLWTRPTDERNQVIFEKNRNRLLEDVQVESVEVYGELMALFETLTDADLVDPARFGMPPEWRPWRIFAENTYEHYHNHAETVGKWLNDPDPP